MGRESCEKVDGGKRDDDSAPPAVPWFLRIPAVVALSVVGAGLGLAVIWFYPHSGPDEAFLARLKWWEENAASLQKAHRLQEPGIWPGSTSVR
jgi:hypothetical protein